MAFKKDNFVGKKATAGNCANHSENLTGLQETDRNLTSKQLTFLKQQKQEMIDKIKREIENDNKEDIENPFSLNESDKRVYKVDIRCRDIKPDAQMRKVKLDFH